MDPTLSATGECLDQYRLDYAAKRKADNKEREREYVDVERERRLIKNL